MLTIILLALILILIVTILIILVFFYFFEILYAIQDGLILVEGYINFIMLFIAFNF